MTFRTNTRAQECGAHETSTRGSPESEKGCREGNPLVMKPVGLRNSLPASDRELLRRLADDSRDAEALVALYEIHRKQIRRTAIRWFGRNSEICNRAVNSLLVSIGRRAATFDPRSEDAVEWIGRSADAEAKRLRQALDAGDSGGRCTRRTL